MNLQYSSCHTFSFLFPALQVYCPSLCDHGLSFLFFSHSVGIHLTDIYHWEDMTAGGPLGWTQAIESWPHLCPYSVGASHCPHTRRCPVTQPLRALCCWHHLGHVCDWTQLKPLYTLLWFWRVCAETSSCHHPRQAWYVSSLLIKFVTYQSSVAASPGPLHTGISF